MVSLTGPSQNKFPKEVRTVGATMLMVEGLEKFMDKTQQMGDWLD